MTLRDIWSWGSNLFYEFENSVEVLPDTALVDWPIQYLLFFGLLTLSAVGFILAIVPSFAIGTFRFSFGADQDVDNFKEAMIESPNSFIKNFCILIFDLTTRALLLWMVLCAVLICAFVILSPGASEERGFKMLVSFGVAFIVSVVVQVIMAVKKFRALKHSEEHGQV